MMVTDIFFLIEVILTMIFHSQMRNEYRFSTRSLSIRNFVISESVAKVLI